MEKEKLSKSTMDMYAYTMGQIFSNVIAWPENGAAAELVYQRALVNIFQGKGKPTVFTALAAVSLYMRFKYDRITNLPHARAHLVGNARKTDPDRISKHTSVTEIRRARKDIERKGLSGALKALLMMEIMAETGITLELVVHLKTRHTFFHDDGLVTIVDDEGHTYKLSRSLSRAIGSYYELMHIAKTGRNYDYSFLFPSQKGNHYDRKSIWRTVNRVNPDLNPRNSRKSNIMSDKKNGLTDMKD